MIKWKPLYTVMNIKSLTLNIHRSFIKLRVVLPAFGVCWGNARRNRMGRAGERAFPILPFITNCTIFEWNLILEILNKYLNCMLFLYRIEIDWWWDSILSIASHYTKTWKSFHFAIHIDKWIYAMDILWTVIY